MNLPNVETLCHSPTKLTCKLSTHRNWSTSKKRVTRMLNVWFVVAHVTFPHVTGYA